MSAQLDDLTAESVAAGLEDARATLAELWRGHDDEEKRRRCLRALKAVICAEDTMRKADAWCLADGIKARVFALDALRRSCALRTARPPAAPLDPQGHDTDKETL